MKKFSQRLSFGATKNLGVAALLAILIGIVVFSYLTTERALKALHQAAQQLLSAQETVLRVNDYLRAANQNFAVYIRRDRISQQSVLERFELLESRLSRLDRLAPHGPSGRGDALDAVNKARTAFLYYLDEETIDPAADAASAYLRQVFITLSGLHDQLREFGLGRQGTAGAELIEKEIVEADRILNVTELDLRRYVGRERISIEDIDFPIREASKLLEMPETTWSALQPRIIETIADLGRSLTHYRAALEQLGEEDRVTGEAMYPEFERMVIEASGNAEIALVSLNEMMRQHLREHQLGLIAHEKQQQQVLLALGFIGVFLAIAVSYVLGRGLSNRLGGLIEGTKIVGEGSPGYRFEVGSNDEIGLLATAFNDMISELEQKEEALQRHISKLDAANREVLEAKQGLETQVVERTRELREALEEARVANRVKDEFLAKVSHEIRTPLNGIIGIADILLRSGLDERQRRLVGSLHESGDTLLRIINDVLDFSRIKSGRLELMKSTFDPVATIESTIDMVARSAQAKGLEFIYYLPVDFPRAIEGDSDRLRQILLNLFGNAVKFTDRGEVSLHGAVERDSYDDAVLRFEVRDTGIGIPEQARSRVFEAFTQADESSTRRFTGAGLGLTICKQLVEAMGGQIGLSDQTTSGSRFWFTLPIGKFPKGTAQHSSDDLLGRRILIAANNSACRAVLARLVNEFGCVSDLVDNGRAALTRLRAKGADSPYDVVIVDMTLPDLNGVELAEIFHREDAILPIPFILLTADDIDDGLVSSSDGITGVLEKPVRREALWRVLRSVIETPLSNEVEQPLPEKPRALRHLKVLVAEDNPVSQEVMRHILEGLGCQVEVASDGRQALEAFERKRFNIVLLDCQMPDVDGYQVASEIRQREGARQRTPLLALTASAMESDRQHCLAVGMDEYLTKPVNERILREVLSRWCRPGQAL
jgi:signal transduction histidine kinase/DNA-binding response OmpR family regulator